MSGSSDNVSVPIQITLIQRSVVVKRCSSFRNHMEPEQEGDSSSLLCTDFKNNNSNVHGRTDARTHALPT